MVSEKIKSITIREFDDVLAAEGLTVVDFGADWCPPCKALQPTMEELAEEYAGKVGVYTVNADKEHELASRYHVKGLPTVLMFKNGLLADRIVGRRAKEVYQASLQHLGLESTAHKEK